MPYAELVVPNTLIELNIDQELVCVAAASGERPHAVFHIEWVVLIAGE